MTEMTEAEKRIEPPVTDLRDRCPTCNMLTPQHSRWCIIPVIEGKKPMETRQIEGQRSTLIMDSEK